VLQVYPAALVIRTSSLFGPWDDKNFLTRALRALAAGQEVAAIEDVVMSPTYVPDLVDASLDLLIDRAAGLWHLANQGVTSWAQLALTAAALAEISTHTLKPVGCQSLQLPARRPPYSVLTSERGLVLPTLSHALRAYVDAMSASAALAVFSSADRPRRRSGG
jgi:dTDP-4-dehydrorhamnose reductase